MSITQEEVKRITKNLSKLDPNQGETLTQDIQAILQYIDLLNEVDTTWVPPTYSVIWKVHQDLKADRASQEVTPNKLLQCSPQKIIAQQIAIQNIMW